MKAERVRQIWKSSAHGSSSEPEWPILINAQRGFYTPDWSSKPVCRCSVNGSYIWYPWRIQYPKITKLPANYPTAIWRVVMIFGAHVKLRPSTVSLATSRLAPRQDKGPLVYQESKLFNGEAIGVSADLLGVFLWPMIGDFTGRVKRYQGTKTINTQMEYH